MALRSRLACGVLAVVCTLAVGATLAAQARAKASAASTRAPAAWTPARTPDGHPDFQGVWANNTITPLQRPKQWEGKSRLTDAEVAELQKFAAQITENDGDAQFGDSFILAVLDHIAKPNSYDPGTGNYNQFWVVERDWHDRRTSLIVDPADGKIPSRTPDAEKRRAAEIEHRKAHAFEDPEVFPLGERCVNFSVPRLQAGYNSYLQIVQAPGYVTIMNEMAHDARIVPLDGRPHLDPRIRVWNGDSRGRWDGDTLVIDTTNFSPKSDFMGSHENLHLVERLTRVGRDVLNYEFTIDDPTTWTDGEERRADLRVRVPRGERRDGRHAARPPLRGARGREEELQIG